MRHLLLFGFTFVAEVLATAWTRVVIHGRAHQSALISALIVPLGALATKYIVESTQLWNDVAIMAVACFIGNYVTRKLLKLKK